MKKTYFSLLIVIILSVSVNLFLHYKNNQYTHDDIKGYYGVVDYTKSQQDIHYLTSGWQLYKNEDNILNIQNKRPDAIVDIYQPLDVDKAIYRLKILDDEPPLNYTFVLPEIFSQYQFYINGKRIHQQDNIQSIHITIPGEKILECVLISENQNHYYSGQVFPIAFGESTAIDHMQGLQNYSQSAFMIIAILSMFVMGLMYMLTGKEKIYLYAFFLSICIAVYLSHYFIHLFIPVQSILSYLTEDISYYFMLALLLLFLHQFYAIGQILTKKYKVGIFIGLALVCLVAYSMPYQTHLLYYVSLFLKLNILFLLIYTLWKQKQQSMIDSMIIFFVISYIFDFSYHFEPIYLGWGVEIASILLIFAYNVHVIQRQISLYKSYHILKTKENMMLEYTNTKAHDMKAPMATMKGYVELLQGELNDKEKDHILRKLDEKVGLLSSRLTQLQNLDYETCLLNKEKTNLKDLLEEIVDSFEVQLLKREREICKDFIDFHYILDAHYFKIIIENLLMNAIEHSDQTKINIRLYKEENCLKIEIQDYGDIINVEEMNILFKQGFSTKGSSRGYGLYISQKIIEQHNGDIEVISNKREGTRFIVSLPL